VNILATLYHSCHREICQEETHYRFAIVNYIGLVRRSASSPGRLQAVQAQSRPGAVFDDVQPYVVANGLDPVRVREVLHNAFAPASESEKSNPF
jgi:heterodisulfide reductase subunit D